jgi:hypothetical protein
MHVEQRKGMPRGDHGFVQAQMRFQHLPVANERAAKHQMLDNLTFARGNFRQRLGDVARTVPREKSKLPHVHAQDRQLHRAHQFRGAEDGAIAAEHDGEVRGWQRWIGEEMEIFVNELAIRLDDGAKFVGALGNVGAIARTEEDDARFRFPVGCVSEGDCRLHSMILPLPRLRFASAARQPTIIDRHKRPILRGQLPFKWIPVDVLHDSLHVRSRAQEHFPTRTTPNGMLRRSVSCINQATSTFLLQIPDHRFCAVPMFANQEMHVVGHDRTGVASIFLRFNHRRKCLCDDLHVFSGELEKLVIQNGFCILIKLANLGGLRLDLLATFVEWSKFRERLYADFS